MLLLRNLEESGTKTSRDDDQDHNLALGSERESIGLNQAEQFTFEYWYYYRQTNKFEIFF